VTPTLETLESVLVLGLGASGKAAAEALLDRGIKVRVVDSDRNPALVERAEALTELGAEVLLGNDDPSLVETAGLVVASPGVPPSSPVLVGAVAAGVKVWSEVELAWHLGRLEERTAPLIAVTGTNGKTTTTSILEWMLEAAGRAAIAAGNIGLPLTEAVRSAPPEAVLVCEASSFQLAFIESFHPGIAVVLNVADDHYDWHSGHRDYLAAKARITENQTADDLLIVNATDPACVSIALRSSAAVSAFAVQPSGVVRQRMKGALGRDLVYAAGINKGTVVLENERAEWLIRIQDIPLYGPHNIENILAACLVAMQLGVAGASMADALRRFQPLPHRATVIAELGGIRFVDDSKATNPHATRACLAGMERVVLIAGGRAKGLDLNVLSDVKEHLVAAVVMGEAASELERIFYGLRVRQAGDIEEAVAVAASFASPGDTVLLSPACSSLDQYSSYVERGERFIRAVMRRR
jgi:UDP-N-acetylmuramoylalanine--D-glutamate ligase